jgi:hypothetical protein
MHVSRPIAPKPPRRGRITGDEASHSVRPITLGLERRTRGRSAALGRSGSAAGDDKRLWDLVGELSTRSEEFRVRWATHHVKLHRTGVKRFHHPVVGDLTLDVETLDLPGDPGQKLLTYSAEPGSSSHQALQLLASWATTPQERPADRRT